MKKPIKSILLYCIICLLFCGSVNASAGEDKDAVGEVKRIIDGIISFNTQNAGINDIQGYIDDHLTGKVGGTAEWYVLALSQYGDYDLTKYRLALEEYLKENDVKGASARLKFALLLSYSDGDKTYIEKCLNDDTIGGQGIMSYVFGLHLYNNGYSGIISKDEIITKLKEMRHEDGGWSVTGNLGDVDVTAMTLTALAPLKDDSQVVELIDDAVAFLSERQLEDGDFSSFGVRNAESTAQVIVALSALGIDCASDERFIKNGNNPIDGILLYRLADGSFIHKEGAQSSPTATVQTFYSMVAYLRMYEGLSPLYVQDKAETKPTAIYGKQSDDGQSGEDASEKENVPEEIDVTGNGQTETDLVENGKVENRDDGYGQETNVGTLDADLNSHDYKPYAIIGIVALCLAVCIVLWIKKKHWKNYAFVGCLGMVMIAIVLLTNFSSPEDYYGKSTNKTNVIGTVTMSIRCDILKGERLNEHIPDDFCILDTTEFDLEDGETAYDILLEGAKRYSISVEHEGSSDIVYISGINYLYENDYGDLSGWVYKVNGVLPSVGCAGYALKPGDKVEWCYTLNLGNDVTFDGSGK